jgi:formylglycine-generating enzyme required for sulfatase activity
MLSSAAAVLIAALRPGPSVPHQDTSTVERKKPATFTNSLGMEFVKVPRGTFWMGGGSSEEDRAKMRPVTIDRDFELGVYEVTQEEWLWVMNRGPGFPSPANEEAYRERLKGVTEAEFKRFPVEASWKDVQEFLRRLNEQECDGGYKYRLPTEAEWEYACRGGASSREECSFDFYFDKPTNVLSPARANFDDSYPGGNAGRGRYLGRPTRVGSYEPNRLGLYDMHGNVWEWTDTASHAHPVTWVLPAWTRTEVCRGGAFGSYNVFCRAAYRVSVPAIDSFDGFRVARSPVRREPTPGEQSPGGRGHEEGVGPMNR